VSITVSAKDNNIRALLKWCPLFGYINNAVINSRYILIHTCVLSNKLLTLFLSDFVYLYRTVVNTNRKILVLFLYIYFFQKKKLKTLIYRLSVL
jgi:hypothetical protein